MKYPAYPKYKDSGVAWLGEVPEHWDSLPLRALAQQGKESFIDGDWVELPHIIDEGVRLIQTGNIGLGFYKEQGYRYISEESFKKLHCTEVYPNDVLICRLAEPVGRACLAPLLNKKMITSVDVCILKTSQEHYSSFIVYLLSSSRYLGYIDGQCRGGTRDRVSRSFLGAVRFAVPPLPEQRAIAAFLDAQTSKLDTLIAKERELIDKLKEKRAALITRTVTRGLPPEAAKAAGRDPHPKVKDSGVEWLGEVPEHWEVKPIKFFAKVGNGSTPNRDNSDYWEEGDFPWLNSSVVNKKQVQVADQFVTVCALSECHLPIVEPPAVLVGITGEGKTRGMATILLIKATISQHIAYIKPLTDVNCSFLYRVMETAYSFLRAESEGGGSTKGAITCAQLGALKIPAPEANEQRAIVTYLDRETAAIDALVAKVETAIDRLQEYRAALITAAVTGQIDVREAVQ